MRRACALAGLTLALVGAGGAVAHPGHGSCKQFGVVGAELARAGVLVDLILFDAPGRVDDTIAFLHGPGGECVPR